MTSWQEPDAPLSESAAEFRRLLAERWSDYHPRWGFGASDDRFYEHLHAHPDFRDPLSSEDDIRASAQFHAAVVTQLADGSPLTFVTFDYENRWDGETFQSQSGLTGHFDREFVGTILEPIEDDDDPDDESKIHAFISTLEPDDARLRRIWQETAQGAEPLTVTNAELTWLARPYEECVALHSCDADDLETLRTVQAQTWSRWGIPAKRQPFIDLAAVSSYFEDRREAWAGDGVHVVTGPQFRTWSDPDTFDSIMDALPEDLSLTDWFLIGLESATAEATLIVHDTGACTVYLDPDTNDEDSETIFEDRGRAGSLDFEGVAAVMERVVATLKGNTDPSPN